MSSNLSGVSTLSSQPGLCVYTPCNGLPCTDFEAEGVILQRGEVSKGSKNYSFLTICSQQIEISHSICQVQNRRPCTLRSGFLWFMHVHLFSCISTRDKRRWRDLGESEGALKHATLRQQNINEESPKGKTNRDLPGKGIRH